MAQICERHQARRRTSPGIRAALTEDRRGAETAGNSPDAPHRDGKAPTNPGTDDAPGDGARAPDTTDGKDGASEISATSPEASKLRDFATEQPTGTEAILLKPPGRVTENGMLNLIRDPAYRTGGSTLPEAVRKWNVNFFGTGPVPRDITGHQIDAPPIRPIPTVPTAPSAAEGGDLVAGMARIAGLVAGAANAGALAPSIKRLQATLNGFDAGTGAAPLPLRRDGSFGPLTRARLRQVIAGRGTGAVAHSLQRTLRI